MSELTNKRLEEIRGTPLAMKSMTETEQMRIIDELLSLRTLRDAGDEEVEDLLNSIPAPELNEKWVKLTGEMECLRNDLREAREEIERLNQIVRELKDNFGEMEVGA